MFMVIDDLMISIYDMYVLFTEGTISMVHEEYVTYDHTYFFFAEREKGRKGGTSSMHQPVGPLLQYTHITDELITNNFRILPFRDGL